MVGWIGLGFAVVAVAAPIPAPAPSPKVSSADRRQMTEFAHLVYGTAQNVVQVYAKPVEMNEMIAGAIRGLYEEAGLPTPDEDLLAARRAANTTELLNVLIDARVRLGNLPAVSGPRGLLAAINGFRHATDPYCGLANSRVNSYVSVDMDYGIGLELQGATGRRWSVYQVERFAAVGAILPTGLIGPQPKPDDVPSPASFPWQVKRVIPGSPGQRAGIKPGDVITHLDGVEVTAERANKLFAQFAYPPDGAMVDPFTGMALPVKRELRFRRAGVKGPIQVKLETQVYAPDAVFGVLRVGESTWDCMLDREYKIGYVRIGPIEYAADRKLAEMLDGLMKQGCRGLILDLRWCPGGYVNEGTRIAGMFLKPNTVVAEVRARSSPNLPARGQTTYRADSVAGGKCLDIPLLVLVGSETTGGGEMIAAALQDSERAVVMGQRTVGRASIQTSLDIGFGGMQFKVTTGETLRPNGKPRQRSVESKPTDDWGIRPSPGFEVPVTADLSRQLRQWADEHSIRPADSREALPFDDPAKDPFRTAALAHLRKRLGPP